MAPPDFTGVVRNIRQIPPITRFALASTILFTFLPMFRRVVTYYDLIYTYDAVFVNHKYWKLWSSFFLGSAGMNILWEGIMLHHCLSFLETNPYNGRASDLTWQLFFACAGIFGATRPRQTYVFFTPLISCLSYMLSETGPIGSSVNFLGVLTLPLPALPYAYIFLTLMTSGPELAGDATVGAVVGFIWFFLIWRGRGKQGVLARWGRAPGWLKKAFGEEQQPINGGGLKNEGSAGSKLEFNLGGPCGGCCGRSAKMWAGGGHRLGRS